MFGLLRGNKSGRGSSMAARIENILNGHFEKALRNVEAKMLPTIFAGVSAKAATMSVEATDNYYLKLRLAEQKEKRAESIRGKRKKKYIAEVAQLRFFAEQDRAESQMYRSIVEKYRDMERRVAQALSDENATSDAWEVATHLGLFDHYDKTLIVRKRP